MDVYNIYVYIYIYIYIYKTPFAFHYIKRDWVQKEK